MTTISHDNLIASGFSFMTGNQSYRIKIGNASFGVVQNGDRWLFSPLPMEHASLVNITTMEELKDMIPAING